VATIAEGRRGLEIEGEAEAGRISFRDGLAEAMAVFQEGAISDDARTFILIDHAYVTQEMQFCDIHDADAISSLNAAISGFDDALRVLPTVKDAAAYQTVETSYPHAGDYRVNGMPKDAYHVACIAHKVRLRNALRTPGLSMTEKAKADKHGHSAGSVLCFARSGAADPLALLVGGGFFVCWGGRGHP
jgi:hypothetical protein